MPGPNGEECKGCYAYQSDEEYKTNSCRKHAPKAGEYGWAYLNGDDMWCCEYEPRVREIPPPTRKPGNGVVR